MIDVDFTQAIDRLQKIVDDSIRAIPGLAVALIVFSLFLVIAHLTRLLIFRYAERARRRRNFALVMGRVSQWAIITFGFLVGAVIVFPNFSPAELIQLLGLGSVAVGFAFRDVLQNFLVGLLILWNEPFRIGDQMITLRMRWWIAPALHNNFLQSRDLILTAVMARLSKSKAVRIPYPTYDLLLHHYPDVESQ